MNCLDSSFVVDCLDPDQPHHDDAVAWMREHGEGPLAVPAICAFEVLRGSARAGDDRFDRVVAFLRTTTVLDLDLAAAITAGELDGQLHAAGTPLGPRDTLVAAASRETGSTLVTRDGDFADVPELDVTFYAE